MSEDATSGGSDRRLIEAGMVLASELSLDAVLLRITELAVELTGARYGALGVLSPDGHSIQEFITVGITEEERAALGDPPTGHGLLGVLIRDARPLRIPVIGDDPRSVGFPAHHPEMTSLLGAPIAGRGRVFGNLYLTDKQDAAQFTDDDERVLVVLATQAAIAVENAQLYEQARRADEERRRLETLEERERIAEELHDGVVQSLFAVGMSLQGASAMSRDTEVQARLQNSVDDIDRTIRDLRNYIFGLRPGVLADRTLDDAIREVCGEFESRTGVVTIADVDPDAASELSSSSGDVIQLIREALSNVGRHAAATTCRVSLRRAVAGIELSIDDDGKGFEGEPATGMGIGNLRARVERMRGTFDVRSSAGEGTTVTALLPR